MQQQQQQQQTNMDDDFMNESIDENDGMSMMMFQNQNTASMNQNTKGNI